MREINQFILDSIGLSDKPIFDVPDAMGKIMARMGFLPGAPITWDQWQSLQSDNVMPDGAKGFADLGIHQMLWDDSGDVPARLLYGARGLSHDATIPGTIDQPVATFGQQPAECPSLCCKRRVVAIA